MCASVAPERASKARYEELRLKVRFPTAEAMRAAQAIEAPGTKIVLNNERHHFLSIEMPSRTKLAEAQDRTDIFRREFDAEVVPDFRYDVENDGQGFDFMLEGTKTEASLFDVVKKIRADRAWSLSRGSDTVIAIVDTGIAGTRPEFPDTKRAGGWAVEGADPWTDWQGHGSMCACIAAGTTSSGGAFDGVAPDAKLVSCRTHFYDSELTSIYDFLTDMKNAGHTVVASNSFGLKTGQPPESDQDSDFLPALDAAILAGVHVFFSAGNNHGLSGGRPERCDPNSIWLHKSRADVMAVSTCDMDERMWYYSSRGPGQWYSQPGMNPKPDVTAPTPKNGQVVYGEDIRSLADGWGTSGACPQVAGLAALMLSANPNLTRQQVFDTIRGTARHIGHEETCQGAGLIDCDAAVDQALSLA